MKTKADALRKIYNPASRLEPHPLTVHFDDLFTVLNISTSAQLTFAMPADFKPPRSTQPTSSVSYFPYFDNTYLAVAASLNGGNVLASFVEILTAWMKDLGRCTVFNCWCFYLFLPFSLHIRLVSLILNMKKYTKKI